MFAFLTFCTIFVFKSSLSTPIHSAPPEFFTCENREPNFYSDTKRDCVYYWQCLDNGTQIHHRCDAYFVFDDVLKKCVKAISSKQQMCIQDYGHFTSAKAFCQGRPYPDNEHHSEYYPDRSSKCSFYYLCARNVSEFFGKQFQCNSGLFFDQRIRACVSEDIVSC